MKHQLESVKVRIQELIDISKDAEHLVLLRRDMQLIDKFLLAYENNEVDAECEAQIKKFLCLS